MSLVNRWGNNNKVPKDFVTNPGRATRFVFGGSNKRRATMALNFRTASSHANAAMSGTVNSLAYSTAVKLNVPEYGLWRGGQVTTPYARIIGGSQRKAFARAAIREGGRGLRKLPMRTKLGVPITAAALGVGFASWMNRKRKSKYYTHYYDF